MTHPARPLLISYILFGIATAVFIAAMIVGASEAARGVEAVRAAETASQEQSTVEPTPAPEAQQAVENEASEQVPAVGPVSTPTAPADTAAPQPQQGAHIPFTQDPVTPGDPESYVDTVGQCPFYEMAGPKGCTPPPDIECNADWSVCTKKEL
jgi:guanyl-specific ribonuclease Sa